MASVDPVSGWPGVPRGLQRFHPARDLAGVIRLIEEGFRDDLEAADRRWLAELQGLAFAGPLANLVFRLAPREATFTGVVWYDDGELVGNVSIVRSSPRVWGIANVVTSLEARRRGIAGRLMTAAIDMAAQAGAEQLQLQVRADNVGAHALYERFGFWQLGRVSVFRARVGDLAGRHLMPAMNGLVVGPWSAVSMQRIRNLVRLSGATERGGPLNPLVQATASRWPLSRRWQDLMNGRQSYPSVVLAGSEVVGLALVQARDNFGPHRLDLLVHPAWRGRVEPLLISRALNQLRRHAPHEVDAEVDVRDTGVIATLELAGFRRLRTLDRLALDLG